MPGETDKRFAKLEEAFKTDNFMITKKAFTAAGRIGLEAQHMTAINYGAGRKKKSYYIEGTAYERGFLLGLLAEPEIADMAINFTDNLVPDYFAPGFLSYSPAVQNFLVYAVNELARKSWPSQPRHIRDEVAGMVCGCGMANGSTRVTEQRLMALNAGLDALCALVYTGKINDIIPRLLPEHIRLPMQGSAFSAFNNAAPGEHFFGRDFMFDSGNMLHNHLAHIITLPAGGGEKIYPFVSVTAPGLIGSAGAMNSEGVAGGLNMSPSAVCDAEDLGFYSLPLLRESVMLGGSAAEAADVIRNAKRGVPWNYVLSDGCSDTACTVEAGASTDDIDFLSCPAKELLPYLPDREYLSSNAAGIVKNGCAVRWCGAPFPDSYLDFNKGLWEHYNTSHDTKLNLYDDAFSPGGYINRTPDEKNCPSCLYFAPQRTGDGVHITTNSFLLPQMRLCAMSPWIESIANDHINGIQWRYDELNHQIMQAISEKGGVDCASAKFIINFLSSYGKLPPDYVKNVKSRFGSEPRTEGCATLFDLKNITAESRYGSSGDEWVKTTLPAYVENS